MDHSLLQNLGIVFALGISSQWIAWKLRFPVIILLTLSGIIFGPVLEILDPYAVFGHLLHPLIELAVAIILFEGGLSLKYYEFKQVGKGLKRLFSAAVVLNLILAGLAAHYIGSLSWGVALVVGGILIVTGPTVIIPALREAKLNKSTANYLKWEGIINDPIGAMIAVLIFDFLILGTNAGNVFFYGILKVALVSAITAGAITFCVRFASNRAYVPEFLKIPSLMTLVLTSYIFSEQFQAGSGLLTVTLLGLAIGNSKVNILHELRKFEESLVVFTVSAIFVILSASLDIEVWKELELKHYILIALLSFVIRPIAILLSTINSGMSFKERLLIGLYGPRGIVAASVAGVVGTGLVQNGFEEGKFILPIIFSVVLVTVVTHSLWLKPLANLLGLRNEGENGILIVGASEWSCQLARKLKNLNIPVLVSDSSWYKLAQLSRKNTPTHYGSILADLEHGDPDLTSINYLFALTEDDSYNDLLCHKLGHEFGSDHVYRLSDHEDSFHLDHGLTNKDFYSLEETNEILYENLIKRYHHGWTFNTKIFTKQEEFEEHLAISDEKLWINFMILRDSKRVEMFSKKDHKTIKEHDIVIYYAPESET